ncbi:hypothetical protein LF1_15750 [Rubripirellula obstinata]|uniref:Uncharacterized protein n=1 Tax=Rubripirellula obstinata TaxID=406547 RepID=A0A5B1CH33_9BACT|nr:hypothetical protein [Rubripirellula obstinata]KAA1259049.1 hypothetical protein LF1_15750 [Rubripirellula obstinata]
MTQMLLFTDTAVAPFTAVAPAASPVSATATESLRGTDNQTAIETDIPEPHVRGLNRMGDLARLVLLRHDLMAAQRQEQQQKRQSQRRSSRRAK